MEADDFAYYFRSIPRNNPDNFLPAPILYVNKKSEYETNIYYVEQFAQSVLSVFTDLFVVFSPTFCIFSKYLTVLMILA